MPKPCAFGVSLFPPSLQEFEAWGTPPRYFDDERPAFITVQGQHRFTVFLLALRSSLGLGLHRAGKLSTSVLFEGEGAPRSRYDEAVCSQLNSHLSCNKYGNIFVKTLLDYRRVGAVVALTDDLNRLIS